MKMTLIEVIILCVAYLCGSIPSGKIIARRKGIDIQQRGSGNIGAANMWRVVGKRYGVITFLCDVFKGVLPVLIAIILLPVDRVFWFIVGVTVIIGHIMPIWLQFRGGKGIATGLGVVICLQPIAAALGCIAYAVTLCANKKSSSASIVGLLGVIIVWVILSPKEIWMPTMLGLIAMWTLRKNLAGTVPQFG